MLATLAFQLGPKEKPFYALEGAVANAGTAITWLKENLSIDTELGQHESSMVVQHYYGGDSTMLSSLHSGSGVYEQNSNVSTDVVFVPAFSGLWSPFWKHDSRG